MVVAFSGTQASTRAFVFWVCNYGDVVEEVLASPVRGAMQGWVGWSLTVWENLEVVFSAVSISSADHLLAWLVNYNLKLVSMWFFLPL